MKKKVAVLGATGSIGKSTLDVLRKGDFDPVLFTAHTGVRALLELKAEFPRAALAISSPEYAGENSNPSIEYHGREGLLKAISSCSADVIVNGISGAAGLEPSVAALETGCTLALANKETIVMAGPLIQELEKKKKAKIIPVDSEHSAIFHLIQAHKKENIGEIILTASGGPFRNYSMEQLEKVTVEQALAHPTWKMGPKITVDSATLANKGLEVIEAVNYFGMPPEKVKVVVHPQSVVHSMVTLKDGTVYAQMSKPDMRRPIRDALYWPIVLPSYLEPLEFDGLTLEFGKPDTERFPMLSLAYQACKKGPIYPVIYNAANEIAVDSFMNGKTGFLEIPAIVMYVLNSEEWLFDGSMPDLNEITETDKKAREMTLQYIWSKK